MEAVPNSSVAPAPRYRFGIFEADLRTGELTRDGTKIKLQEQPFQVLVALLEKPGEIVSREYLRQRLWPSDTFVDFDHSLNTAINKLREALRDSAANPRFIETKARRGYRFIAPVQVIANGSAPAIAQGELPAPSSEISSAPDLHIPRVHRGRMRILIALIQVMYLCFYIAALARLGEVGLLSQEFVGERAHILVIAVLITATVGIPVRLYLLSAAAFDYQKTGIKFLRLFPALLLLDELWALAPFFLLHEIGIGLSFAATAALLYLPFSQRTLVRITYPNSA